jgi:hypothetical protein
MKTRRNCCHRGQANVKVRDDLFAPRLDTDSDAGHKLSDDPQITIDLASVSIISIKANKGPLIFTCVRTMVRTQMHWKWLPEFSATRKPYWTA